MEEKNQRLITIISFLRNFISVFFTLFFNIYVLKIVSDIGFIIKINFLEVAFKFLFVFIISKIITSKRAKYIYSSSFILLVICIGLLLVLKDNIIKYIIIFKFIFALEETSFYYPLEMVIMGASSHNSISNFQANMNILNGIATILTPFFSGFIIEKFSYTILFVILIIEAIMIIIISFCISKFYIEDKKLNIKEFWTKSKNYKHLSNIYNCMFFRRISSQGAILTLLPIILFLKLNSELSVGSYNSLFALLSIIFLTLLKIINKKKIKKKFYIPFSILVFISTLFLVFIPSFTTIIIYYVCMNTFAAVIESESCSLVYEAINVDDLKIYNREHDFVFNIYMFFGQVISYLIAYILYRFFYNANILSIVVSILMFFLIISCVFLQKTENEMQKIR